MSKLKLFPFVAICMVIIAACKKESYNAEAQLAADDKLIVTFLGANLGAFTKHESGIYYQIVQPGAGASATATSQVTVNYTGKLLDGKTFDQTTAGTPVTFRLGQVIAGWQIGVPLVKKGGTVRLIIPSYYAYQNSSPSGAVPANSVLDFTIEVVNVQ